MLIGLYGQVQQPSVINQLSGRFVTTDWYELCKGTYIINRVRRQETIEEDDSNNLEGLDVWMGINYTRKFIVEPREMATCG